jgi:lysyl endopeptidase
LEVPSMQTHRLRSAAVAVGLVLSPGTWALAQERVVEDGRVTFYQSQLAGYPAGSADHPSVHEEIVVSVGAEFVRVHFTGLNLAKGDYLTLTDPKGRHLEILQGKGDFEDGDLWSFAVPGDTVVLNLHAGSRDDVKGEYGYRIDSLVHGTLPLELEEESDEIMSRVDDPFAAPIEPKSICGTVGYENVACRPHVTSQRSVARLLAVSSTGSRSVRCTGWMVRGSNANTLITNNHCFSTAAAVRSIEAQFNFQTTTCNGTTTAPTTSYRGNALLRTVGMPLDYTLATLFGSPEATWGEIIPLRRRPRVGELIAILQHPAGRPKKIGYFENSAHTNRCDVESVSGTQLRYSCDTEGGSSGSVVLGVGTSTSTNTAVGLHHLGGCPNAATALADICTSAGSLLQCQ